VEHILANKRFKITIIILVLFNTYYLHAQNPINFKHEIEKANKYLFLNNDTSINCLSKIKSLSNLNSLQTLEISFLDAQIHSQRRPVSKTKEIFETCLSKIKEKKIDKPKFKARILISLGGINASNSELNTGLPQLHEALALLKNTKDKNLITHCKLRIIEAHRVKKQFGIGFKMINKLIDEGNLSPRNKTCLYGRLSAYYAECEDEFIEIKNRRDSVYKYSKLSLILAEKHKFVDYIASVYNEIGTNILLQKGSTDLALEKLYSAAKLFKNLAYKADYANTYNNITLAYLKKGKFRKTIKIGLDLLKNRTANEYPQIYRKTNQYLSDSYDSIGNYRLSKQYLEEVYKIEKKLFTSYLNKEITSITTKYNFELQEIKTEEERKAHRDQLLSSKNKIGALISILVLFVLLLILTITISRLRKRNYDQAQKLLNNKNELLENNIIHQNKTLTANALKFILYNNLFDEISINLTNIEYVNKSEVKDNINKIILDIRNKKDNKTWTDFEKSFIDVHPNFYKNLNKQHSKLTSKDLRMCALLKLNLSTKEIAQIINISIRGVESARYRIRQKIELEDSEELISHLQKF